MSQNRRLLLYLLCLLPLVWVEAVVLGRIPFFGGRPFLLPLAVFLVAIREGANFGAVFGILTGIFAVYLGHGRPGAFILIFALLAFFMGLLFRYGLQSDFFGCLLGTVAGLLLLELLRMGYAALTLGVSFFALLPIALPEFLWTLAFFPVVYWLYAMAFRRSGAVHVGGVR